MGIHKRYFWGFFPVGVCMDSSKWKMVISLVLGLVLSLPLPQSAQAAQAQNLGMNLATTEQALLEISSGEAQSEVNSFFAKDEVRKMLFDHGVSREEIDQRLASLSDQEIFTLSTQVKQARAGGDILITVLVILLIIYFAKRI